MRRLLCARIPSPGNPTELAPDEAHHATKVLRLGDGSPVEAMDGAGTASAAVLRLRGKTALLEAGPAGAGAGIRRARPGEVVALDIEMAILKGDAMEWAIEKCVELGVRRVDPLI